MANINIKLYYYKLNLSFNISIAIYFLAQSFYLFFLSISRDIWFFQ